MFVSHTTFTIYNQEQYDEIKITALRSHITIQKFLWDAAMKYQKAKSRTKAGQITEFMDVDKPDPDDVFNIRCWDKYITDKKTLKKSLVFFTKLDDLLYKKEQVI